MLGNSFCNARYATREGELSDYLESKNALAGVRALQFLREYSSESKEVGGN